MQALAKTLGVSVDELLEGARELPEVRIADPAAIDRRIILVDVQTDDTHITTRFPVAAAKKAVENGALERLVGAEAFGQMAGILHMVDVGTTGPLVEVDSSDARVRITVEDYES